MGEKRFKHIKYEEIRPRLGCSCMPKDLSYFTEEENKFRMEVREWAINEILPYADKIDRDNDKQLAIELGKKTAKHGYSNQMIPKEWGGGGRNCVAEMIVLEELASASFAAAGIILPSCTFLALPIYKFGTEELKRKYMVPLLRGEAVGGMAMTEPEAGSDFAATATEAVKDGGDWVLNGEKRFIGNGSTADYLLTFAVTNPDSKRIEGRLTAFVIETANPGFEVVKDYDILGLHGMALAWLRFDNLRVPQANVLGEVNKGFEVGMAELDPERAASGGVFLGIMRSAYELAVKYSMEREQFGRPISSFEAISFRLADMYAKIEATRLLVWRCAKQVDLGVPATKESSMLKFFAAEACIEVITSAFQIIGGIAYSTDYPIERYLRDSRVFTVFGGTDEIQRYIVARTILREAREWPRG